MTLNNFLIRLDNQFWVILFITVGILLWSACPEDDMEPLPPPDISSYDKEGFFIINSGGENANGSISYYHREFGLVKNKLYQAANSGENLSVNVNAMELIDNKAYIVASGSDKIIIANPFNLSKIGEITGFDNPRHILAVKPGRAYVSQWGYQDQFGSIQIVDLNTNAIIDSIPLRPGPEEMLKLGNSVYITNTGGLLIDSVVTKVSVASDMVLQTIEVGKAPTYLEVDKNLDLWVLSRGIILDPNSPETNIPGQLVKIKNDQVDLSIPVRTASGPLTINRDLDKLYFVQSGWVYEHPIENTELLLFPYIERFYAAIDFDPLTGAFIGADPIDFVENSVLFLFDEDKTPLDTVEIGKGAVGYTFFF